MPPEEPGAVPQAALLKSFVDTAPLPVLVLDAHGIILQWNPAAAEVFGWNAGETLGRPNPIVPASKQAEFQEIYSRILDGVDIAGMELQRKKKDGSPIDVALWTTGIRDDGGRVVGVLAILQDITERKRAEAERLRQAALLKAQQEASPDGVLVVDEEGAIISYNRRFVEMWGIPEDVIASKSDERAIQSILDKLADPEAFLKRVMHLYRRREEHSRELIALKDGRTFERHSSPIFGAESRYHGRVWYFRDITERMRIEEALRVQTAMLHAQIEASPDGIIVGDDATGEFVFTNRRFADMWRIPRNVLETKSSRRAVESVLGLLVDPDGFAALIRENSLHPEKNYHGEIALKDGRTFERFSSPIYDARKALYGRVSHYRDITARKKAEEDLRRQTHLLKTILDNMAEGVAVVDAAGKFMLLNRAAHRITGVDATDAIGTAGSDVRIDSLWSKRYRAFRKDGVTPFPADEMPLRRALRGEPSEEVELCLRDEKTPREVVVQCNARPIRDALGAVRGGVVVFRDVTERRRAAEAEALREHEAMQRDFIANVSHEFRTPVAAIKGFAETLILGGLEDPKHRLQFAKTIERHANRLSRLVEDLLELSSLESGKRPPLPEAVELEGFVREAVAGILPLARRHRLAIEVDVEPGLKVLADKAHLEQIFQHLCENAIKFNRRGGRIRVEGRAADGAARVAISDTGAGIPAKDLPRIFDRFYRSGRDRPGRPAGTGLGLSIVKQSVEANGGRVWAESAEGRGSTFRFSLPLA